MNMRTMLLSAAGLMGLVVVPSSAAAHCDSMDGPVVKAAQRALQSGKVELVLMWVRLQDELEIREAFARTVAVRKLSTEAESLADRWFFETLVRVHRAGEGEPYTGLKPAGIEPAAGIAAADRALALGSMDTLAQGLTSHLGEVLRERFERVQSLRGYDLADVEAGRRYVHAYVEFIHFVERLHAVIAGEGTDPQGKASAPEGHVH